MHPVAIMVAALVVSYARSAPLGNSDAAPFVIGGEDAQPGQFPDAVSIQVYDGEYHHMCGGILIDRSWIVTAGHCLDQVDPEAVSILAGAPNLASPDPQLAVRMQIAAYDIHEEYDPDHGVSLAHDIALIQLPEPISLNNNIQVASLQNQEPLAGDSALVAGWGQTQNGELTVSSQQQWTKLNIVAAKTCQESLLGFATILEDQICAAAPEGVHAECKGDSGGPLYDENGLVVGVVSWSRKPCGLYPGVFTSIPKHYSWIRERTGLDNL